MEHPIIVAVLIDAQKRGERNMAKLRKRIEGGGGEEEMRKWNNNLTAAEKRARSLEDALAWIIGVNGKDA
jgi:predicted  nucleic acid-binding Zn-ribbon protein